MTRTRLQLLALPVLVLLAIGLVACARPPATDGPATEPVPIAEDGHYLSRDDVALYLHLFGTLPGNYLSKSQAEKLGWVPSRGNLWEVAPGSSIGGDRFGNREGRLPNKEGRRFFECDVNYGGGFRGAERLVYSNDGLIYYTADHYETFVLLYGEEDD